jgi:predicted ATPase
MITGFRIKNFKCFEELSLTLGRLTLLAGFNGGGKSTAIQPLLLLSQNMRLSNIPTNYALNGLLVQLGTVGDVLPSGISAPPVQFFVRKESASLCWSFLARAGDRFLRIETKEMIADGLSAHEESVATREIDRTLSKLIYISAVREGTADAFPSPNVSDDEFSTIGVDGRFASYWYDQMADEEVSIARRHPNEPAGTFRKQLDAWIGALFPGAQANVQALPQVSLLSLQFRLSEIGPWRRPANIGYGLTYAFPILVALLTARDGQVVIVDSPEAHLHPSAQSEMGRILAHFAGAGVQVVVETHSDHLLNGARLAVKEGRLPHSSLQIHFFSGPTLDGHGVVSPTVDSEGRIYEWPAGFFDQSERDFSLLTDWK